jgi:HEAT repeat protein
LKVTIVNRQRTLSILLKVLLLLNLLVGTNGCFERTRKIRDPVVVRAKTKKQLSKNQEFPKTREITLQDLHSPAFSLRKRVCEELLSHGQPGELEYDLAVLHEADGQTLDPRDPTIPEIVMDAANRLEKAAIKPGGGRVILALISEMQEDSCPVRHLMALILAKVPGSDVSRSLVDKVRNSSDIRLKRCAAKALSQREEADIALALIPALINEDCGEAAALSVVRLSKKRDHRNGIEEAVLKALATDDISVGARVRLIQLSASIKLPQAGQIMTQWLSERNDVRVSMAAARALAVLPSRFAIQQLRQALSDPRAAVRALIVDALVAAKDVLSSETFRILARRDADWRVRKACAASFGALNDMRSEAVLLAALSDNAWQVRVEALGSLKTLKFATAAISIRARLSSSQVPQEREAVALALGALKDESSIDALGQSLKKDVEKVRIAAAQALGLMGTAQALLALGEGLHVNKDESLRAVLLAIIRACRQSEALQSLAVVPLRRSIFMLSQQAGTDVVLKTSGVVTAHKMGQPESGLVLRSLGDSMLVRLSSEKLSERRLGHHQLIEIAGRDFSFNPSDSEASREKMQKQIQQWWAWKKAGLLK